MLKVNFDAASNANSMLSCAGIVIRDNLGRFFGSQSVPTTYIPTAFAAKALACSHTVHLALDFGMQEVTIEGDPLTVIRKVRSPLHDALSIGAYIQNVKPVAPLFHRYFFTHASRDGNTVAYLLAIIGL